MIVCKDCGHKNQNQTTFCEACGTFLEWAGESVLTGQHQAIPAPDAPVEAAAADRARRSRRAPPPPPPPRPRWQRRRRLPPLLLNRRLPPRRRVRRARRSRPSACP